MLKNNKQKGITLISLVITVIILLILAGVAINIAVDSNGLIAKTREAKDKSDIEHEKETISLARIEMGITETEYADEKSKLQGILDGYTVEGKTEVEDFGNSYEVYFVESERYYEIYDNGEISEAQTKVIDTNPGDITKDAKGNELAGTEENPYEVNCIEDLVQLSKEVNENANTFADKKIKLNTSLNFKSKYSYIDSTTIEYGDINQDGTTQSLIEELTTGIGFTPIGVSNSFDGIFDGNGQSLKNYTAMIDDAEITLDFGIFGENNGTIQNLTVTRRNKCIILR